MCETLQLNWKLPSMTSNNNNNKRKTNKKSNDINNNKKSKKGCYTLRACSIKKRSETELRKAQPKKRGPKPKPRPLPMSKYRRKTANLRERQRMGEINNAFEDLRSKIPSLAVAGKGRCEKMTKINILHVTINYIRALENILETGDAGVNVYGTAVVQSPLHPLPINSPEPDSPKSNQGTPTKKQNKRRQKEFPNLLVCHQSGSEDSGIVEDEEGHDQTSEGDGEEGGEDPEDDAEMCPDWTELTSTLEFPPANVKLNPPPPLSRGNLDTMLTGSANDHDGMRRILQPKSLNISELLEPLENKAKSEPMELSGILDQSTANKRIQTINRQPSFGELLQTLEPASGSLSDKLNILQPKSLNRQLSFGGLCEPLDTLETPANQLETAMDLFSDLNSGLNMLSELNQGVGLLDEDVFQMIF